MRVDAEESHGVVNDEASGSATVQSDDAAAADLAALRAILGRSHRATDSIAGLPMALAALKFAFARHAGSTGRSTTVRSSPTQSK